jgi:outer membrane biogenesis lipoprotein LolB
MSALDNLKASFDRMNDRERRLVLLTATVAAVLLIGGIVLGTGSALDSREKRVKKQQEQLDQILSFESDYRAAEAAEKQAVSRLTSNKISLFSRLNQAATKLGLSLRDLNEREVPVKDAEDVKEVRVEVNVKNISIDKLNEFIKEIEGERSDGLVKVMKMKVKTRHDNDEMLDANLTVATWKKG